MGLAWFICGFVLAMLLVALAHDAGTPEPGRTAPRAPSDGPRCIRD